MSHVDEFIVKQQNDPVLNQLRALFVSSFYEYYQTIELQLNLPKDKQLLTWLNETADETIDEIVSHKTRCFIVYTSSNIMAGFMTVVKDENNPTDIYISQFAIDSKLKHQGYGQILLKHLSKVYPPETNYTCLCRRVNQPALNFYRKCGATTLDDEQIATKYGYNPENYLGFQFTANLL